MAEKSFESEGQLFVHSQSEWNTMDCHKIYSFLNGPNVGAKWSEKIEEGLKEGEVGEQNVKKLQRTQWEGCRVEAAMAQWQRRKQRNGNEEKKFGVAMKKRQGKEKKGKKEGRIWVDVVDRDELEGKK
ncbi:hypothetical protein RUM43_005902 [Polyplax serrata]|uniref:Uncharacterized protein n=1 Tax=Polyplax serrata TaxID=468196 RepID=A0AAN8P0M1_POLSC